MFKGFTLSRLTPAAVAAVALLVSLAQSTTAQNATTATQSATRTPQTQSQPQQATPQPDKTQTQVASTPAGEAVAAKAAEPLYREYRGVTLGMSAADVRAKLGKPQEKSDVMDFYVFNDRERARVYYTDGKATAVIATYIGRDASAPAPAVVLGTEIEAKPDGSMYMMTQYKQAGYWVAYSRTAGDAPMVIITMQKTP
jgi:pyruvate/2-oxoglutarate dehydrogenase complex dihydrolipoamide acyltransferase (E2) component